MAPNMKAIEQYDEVNMRLHSMEDECEPYAAESHSFFQI